MHTRVEAAAGEKGTSTGSEAVTAVSDHLDRRQVKRVGDLAREDAELIAGLAE